MTAAEHLNPRQIRLEGINWDQYKGSHPLGQVPSPYNANLMNLNPGEDSGYHLQPSGGLRNMRREGIAPSRTSDVAGVPITPTGIALPLEQGDKGHDIIEVAAKLQHIRDLPGGRQTVVTPKERVTRAGNVVPVRFEAGSVAPGDTRLAGHIGVLGVNDRLPNINPDYIHWGDMESKDCATCNAQRMYKKHAAYPAAVANKSGAESDPEAVRANLRGVPRPAPKPAPTQPMLDPKFRS
jgi:hypothetical protein